MCAPVEFEHKNNCKKQKQKNIYCLVEHPLPQTSSLFTPRTGDCLASVDLISLPTFWRTFNEDATKNTCVRQFPKEEEEDNAGHANRYSFHAYIISYHIISHAMFTLANYAAKVFSLFYIFYIFAPPPYLVCSHC